MEEKLASARRAWDAAMRTYGTVDKAWDAAYNAAYYTGVRGAAHAGACAWIVAFEHGYMPYHYPFVQINTDVGSRRS